MNDETKEELENKEKAISEETSIEDADFNVVGEQDSNEKKEDVALDDFADTQKVEETPKEAETVVPQETKEEEGINVYKEEETVAAKEEAVAAEELRDKKGRVIGVKYAYPNQKLEDIEKSRAKFYNYYKKQNTIKWLVTGICLLIIIIGWIVPNYIPYFATEPGNAYTIWMVLGITVVAVIVLAVYSILMKRKLNAALSNYFQSYYEDNDAFVFGDLVTDKRGSVDDKLQESLFNGANLYKDVIKVGSRNCIEFKYRGRLCVFADAAAQIKGPKALQTVFLGKFFTISNDYNGPDFLIYRKGNKRALPPTTLDRYPLFEDSKLMVIYGPKEIKRYLTKEVRDALNAFQTNTTLVDVSISVRAGRTYVALGYEDDLMVMPLEKPFNPNPTLQHQEDMKKVFNFVDALDFAISRRKH